MKIVCPTDFSAAAMNAVEYAAKFCQRVNATLTLLYVQPIRIIEEVTYAPGGDVEPVNEQKESAEQMQIICDSVKAEFNVPCDFEIVSTGAGIEKTISDESAHYDLTIIGTNGADTMSQLYLGSHSFRISKKQSGPVIIVPEQCEYRDIINIAFASDCHIGDTMLLKQLKTITDVFNPQVRVVHISEKDTELSREVYKAFCNLTEDALNYDQRITFERIIHENEADAIENFMKKTNADLLALYMEKHSLLYRLFHENIIKKLTSYASYPILVFHK